MPTPRSRIAERAQQCGFANAYQAALARLQIHIETACAPHGEWPERVAAGIRATLAFAAADPDDVDLLTSRAMAAGREGFECYYRVLEHFGEGLRPGRAERPHGAELPEITEKAMIGGLASLIASRLQGPPADLPALAPEAIQFFLTPYLGVEDARRIAEAPPEGEAE